MAKATCTVDGCDRPARTKGLCKPCYRRDYYLRNGERERANFKAWREANLQHEKARWAAYQEERWGEQWAASAAARAERLAADEKACTRCGAVKPKDDFHSDPRKLDGRYSWCKTCFNDHVLAMRDPVAEAARGAAYRATPRGRVKGLSRTGRYRAQKLATETERVDYAVVLAEHGMVCHICTEDIASLDDLHFDHVIPLSKGGPHAAENIRPSHALCNLRKGARLIA
jgi:5-methylcytosine-specific restriction endonuclease McrA